MRKFVGGGEGLMPCLLMVVVEKHDIWEVVVIIDYVCQIGHGFVSFVHRNSQVLGVF